MCSLPTHAEGHLGTDFLNEAGSLIDLVCGKVSLSDIDKAPRASKVSPGRDATVDRYF